MANYLPLFAVAVLVAALRISAAFSILAPLHIDSMSFGVPKLTVLLPALVAEAAYLFIFGLARPITWWVMVLAL